MNERLPDSSGLPLRAMVMVLLFLGVLFLLIGFQAVGSGGGSGDQNSTTIVTTTTASPNPTTTTPPPPPPPPPAPST